MRACPSIRDAPRPTSTTRPTAPIARGRAAPADQRRSRPDLPRDRRHPRGPGRGRVQDRRLPPGRRRDRPRAVRRRLDVCRRRPAADPGRRPGDRRQDRRARDDRPHGVPRPAARRDPGQPRRPAARSRASGPKTVRVVYEGLGVETLEDLRQAAEAGRLRGLKGISASTEQRILEGIEQLESRPQRLLLDRAQAISDDLVAQLEGDARACAGSSRRARSAGGARPSATSTCSSRPTTRTRSSPGSRRSGAVDRVLGAGHAKASVTLLRGPQVDLMVMPPGEAGTYLVHFTGSADHNVALRGIARDRGWSLSEKGFLRIGEDGAAAGRARPPSCAPSPTRPRVYGFLDLAFVEPELREDRGEIEAAREGRLPTLVTRGGSPRRPPHALGLERRRPRDRGHGRGRPAAAATRTRC